MHINFKMVICALLVNLGISIIYLIIRVIRKDYKKGLIMSGFMILAPLIGPLYIFFSWLIYELYFKRRKGIINVEELSLSKERVEVTEKGNLQVALNKVPVEEALIISSNKDTRKLLLDILKDDTGEYIASIYNATDHKDSEVAHYAASAITDIMAKFKQKEKVLRALYLKNEENEEVIDSYWSYVEEFLETKILPDVEKERYVEILADIMMNLEKNMPHKATGERYFALVILYISLENMTQAGYWMQRALDSRPEDLASYKAGLRFYYASSNGPKLLNLMRELMASSIRLDRETLEFIRFYNQ